MVGGLIFIFKKIKTYEVSKNMMIFEYEPTGNTACLLSESSGSVWFNSHFWKQFHLGGGMEI